MLTSDIPRKKFIIAEYLNTLFALSLYTYNEESILWLFSHSRADIIIMITIIS